MIYTITLNPAVDKTIIVNDFTLDKVNKVSKIRYDVGGKGINVSKIIHMLHGTSKVCSIIGGDTGDRIKDFLEKESMDYYLVEDSAPTRTNIKIVDYIRSTFTDVNEYGGPFDTLTYHKVDEYLDEKMKKDDILVLSGSLPKDCNPLIYKTWIEKYNRKGVKVILDCNGELLKNTLGGNLYLIKPNQEELEVLCQKTLDTIEDIIFEGKKLVQQGISHVIVSLGKRGALLITDKVVLYGEGMEVDVRSTVGAGDAMVGGFCFALDSKLQVEEAFRLAIACGTASVMCDGSSIPESKVVKELYNKVKISEK